MAKTLLFSTGLGVLIAWNWGRLEQPRPSVGPLVLMIALGIAPVLLPRVRWKLRTEAVVLFAAEAAAVLAAASIALHVWPQHLGRLLGRVGSGFADFYEVLVPFSGSAHPRMHGVLLLAVCVFSLLCALAVAARRPLAAILALAAGAGWPATILPGSDDLGRGAFLLAAALALVAWLRPEGRRAPPQILTGTALVVAALIVSSSGSVAKGQFLGWQNWNFSTKSGKAVGVEFVWRADYSGIHFPQKRTRVLDVTAPARSTYWRATTLDSFAGDRWNEDLVTVEPFRVNNLDVLANDPLLPDRARDSDRWTQALVHVDALRDIHLVSPSTPVAYQTGVQGMQYAEGGVAFSSAPLQRGTEYAAWAFDARPKPAQLARSRPDYPPEILDGGRYLAVDRGHAVPPFGSPGRAAWLADAFRSYPELRRYEPLYRTAERIAGRARNPYAATVALEAWLRSGGNFTYDETPPQIQGMPALVSFVTQTKRGYCQHFAGAMALMLRYLGIPARVAAGFTSGAYDSDRGTWRVYDRNAHTWVEVWFKGYGWLPFDPTPSRGNLGGPYTSSSLSFDANGAVKVLAASAIAGRRLLRFKLGNLGQEGRVPNSGKKAPTPDRGAPGQSRGSRGIGTGAILVLVLLALAALLALAKLALRRSRFLTRDPRRVAGACRREVVDFLLDQGIEVPRSVGPRELGKLLSTRAGVEATAFGEALGLARFGPLSAASAAAREARRELRRVRRRLRHALSLSARLRGLFSLRSVLASR